MTEEEKPEEKLEPIEVKIIKEVEKQEEEDMDYIDMEITDEEIEEFKNGKQ